MPLTYTASDQSAQPRMKETGAVVAMGRYQSTTTLSVSDIVFMVKVPHGSTIIDGYISGTIDNAGTIVKLGIIAGAGTLVDNNLFTGTLSATAVITRFTGTSLPIKVSLSDDAVPRFAWLTLTVNTNASLTVSSSFTVVVEYAAPGAI